MSEIVDQARCTGCGACLAGCPVTAISMDEGPNGFSHAVIDDDACIHCNRCTKACPVLNPPELRSQTAVYAAQSASRDVLLTSASGGAFFEIARAFLRDGGTVFGAAMNIEHSVAHVEHEGASDEAGLARLQGSKYVLGAAHPVFREVERSLKAGERVLFSGLPCQVAGLYGYLGRDYDNLITVDVFCHGNTSPRHFNLYLSYLAKKHHQDIVGYVFRDKARGVGYKPKYLLANGRIVRDTALQEAYWYLFQYAKFFRDSCHTCPYAREQRVGDLSVGDFWGIERERPELLAPNGGPLDPKGGISAVLANSKKGHELLLSAKLALEECIISNVAAAGEAVRTPQPKPADREQVLALFREGDYKKIKSYCVRQMGTNYLVDLIYDTAPVQLLRKLLGRA